MFEDLIEENFSGVVSVHKKRQCLFEKAYGDRNKADKLPNTPTTKFASASAGKAFVAVGIMKLIEEKKLCLSDKIGALLDFDLKEIDPAITISQLLSHTSGIPDYFDESVMEDYAALFYDFPNYRIRKSEDLLPFFIDKPMMYKAGEKFLYNNTGYVVLGLIIEKITGLFFDEYLEKELFQPLKMEGTGYYEFDRLPSGCAHSYIFDKERNEYYTNIYSVDAKGTGAGGAFTTSGDVLKFWQGLKSGIIISKDTFEFMTKFNPKSHKYGYGFWINSDGMPYFMGCDPGVGFVSSYDKNRDTVITILSNVDYDVWKLERKIRECIK